MKELLFAAEIHRVAQALQAGRVVQGVHDMVYVIITEVISQLVGIFFDPFHYGYFALDVRVFDAHKVVEIQADPEFDANAGKQVVELP